MVRDTQTQRRFDSLEQEAFLGLWRAYDRLRTLEEELFDQYGLTPQQYNVLRLLHGVHPKSMRTLDLAGRLVSQAPDITRMLDKLERRGLITRVRPASDRRVVEVAITDAGNELLAELVQPVRDCHVRQLGHLDRDQLKTLIALLNTVRRPHEEPDSPWL